MFSDSKMFDIRNDWGRLTSYHKRDISDDSSWVDRVINGVSLDDTLKWEYGNYVVDSKIDLSSDATPETLMINSRNVDNTIRESTGTPCVIKGTGESKNSSGLGKSSKDAIHRKWSVKKFQGLSERESDKNKTYFRKRKIPKARHKNFPVKPFREVQNDKKEHGVNMFTSVAYDPNYEEECDMEMNVLSDEKRKANYDQFGHAAFEGGGGGGGFQGFGGFESSSFSDIFEDFFSDFGGGSSRKESNRGSDLRYDVSISLEEAYDGTEKNVRYTTYKSCKSCSGSGAAKGSKPIRCDYCSGRGKVRTNQGFFTVQQTCPQCSGYGEMIGTPCSNCSGNGKVQSNENVTVKIPKGVDDGTRIRLSGKGEAGSKGGSSGDLYLFVSVDNHNIFKRSDENLYYEIPISFSDAALGISVEVPSIDGGKSKIKIPAGTQYGKQFRLKGKGMPILKRNVFGDLYIRVVTQVPSSLSKRQREILEEFNEIESNKPDPVIKSFFEKAKKFWKKT